MSKDLGFNSTVCSLSERMTGDWEITVETHKQDRDSMKSNLYGSNRGSRVLEMEISILPL